MIPLSQPPKELAGVCATHWHAYFLAVQIIHCTFTSRTSSSLTLILCDSDLYVSAV